MDKIRVAIIGVGNCASSLVQGIEYYRNAKEGEFIPGIMHVNLGGDHIRDVEFVAAFDIDKNKVGKDLSEAVCAWAKTPPRGTASRPWMPGAPSSTASRFSSPARNTGRSGSRPGGCRSSATTSSPRSGPRSSTAPWSTST